MSEVFSGEPFAVTLSPADHFVVKSHPFAEQMLVKIGDKKRVYAKVKGIFADEPNSYTLRCTMAYKPSPRSRLKHKGVFSKIRYEIL